MQTLPPDVLRLTYEYLDDEDLARACSLNVNVRNKVCNSQFWLNKLRKYNIGRDDIPKYFNTLSAYYFSIAELIKLHKPDDLMIIAIEASRPDLVKVALFLGAIATRGNLLIKAVMGCKSSDEPVEIVKLLLDAGFDRNSTSKLGALGLATQKGCYDMTKLLLNNFKYSNQDLSIMIGKTDRLGYDSISTLLRSKISNH